MTPSAPGAPGPGFRHGRVFAAIWLFYLWENLNALLTAADGLWRDLGLAALVLFAITFLALTGRVRRDSVSVPDRHAVRSAATRSNVDHARSTASTAAAKWRHDSRSVPNWRRPAAVSVTPWP